MIEAEALRFSIIVPSFNHAEYLPRALDSIFGQDYPVHQVLVMDGGSGDATVDILKDYAMRFPQLQWLSELDNGPADAVNKGLARVTGDVIGIQSSDDVYYCGAFSAVAERFVAMPEVGFVYGDVEGIDEQEQVLYTRHMPGPGWSAFFGVSMCLPQSSIFFRSELGKQAGEWDGSIYGCDLDYWMRLLFRTQVAHIRQPLSGWRRYAGQRTRPDQSRRIWDDYWRMIDTSPDLAVAPAQVRRLARASKHLLALRFPPTASRWNTWRHLLIGACLHPGFWRYNPPAMLASQLPGFAILRWCYHRTCKRGRRPAPRAAAAATLEAK